MVIEDIRIHPDFDFDVNKNSGKPRCMQVITDHDTIETPTRITTNSEILAKSEVPLSMSMPMDICIAFRPLEQHVMSSFSTNTNTICSDLIKKTHQFNNLTTRSKLRMSFFQPVEIALDKMNKPQKLNFARIQAEYLQRRLGYDVITYPYLKLSSSDYIDFIDNNYKRTFDTTTVFTLDMKMDESSFKKVLSHLLQKDEPKIIALIYRDWDKTVAQHDFIASKYENHNTIFMACQIEREDKYTHINKLHEVAHNSFDFVALKQNSRGGKSKLDPNKIRLLDPTSKSMKNILSTIQNSQRDIVNEIDVPDINFTDKNLISRMIDGYKGILNSNRKFRKWYYLARVHELIVSKKEFSNFRSNLLSGTVSDYVLNSELKLSSMINKASRA